MLLLFTELSDDIADRGLKDFETILEIGYLWFVIL
jgi:hypothetical protein